MVQVQVRMPEGSVEEIDRLVEEGKFRSRSDAIKGIVTIYIESRKTREFFEMLKKRSDEARKKNKKLIALDDL